MVWMISMYDGLNSKITGSIFGKYFILFCVLTMVSTSLAINQDSVHVSSDFAYDTSFKPYVLADDIRAIIFGADTGTTMPIIDIITFDSDPQFDKISPNTVTSGNLFEHVLPMAHADNHTDSRPFVTTWMTTTPDELIIIPVGGTLGQYTVDWGDGTAEETIVNDRASHTYTVAGTYTVSISGDFTRINLNGNLPNADKLQSIEQWGDIQWSSMKDAFRGASNMVYNAQDAPILSDVADMSRMFNNAASFNGDLSSWDVSNVEIMRLMFKSAASFNGDLSSWDVSGVTSMNNMFRDAASFNGDLSSWNVSNVSNMNRMFYNATAFDQNLGTWYIVLDDNTIDDGDTDKIVGSISTQNDALTSQSPVYSIDEDSGDGDSFEIVNNALMLKSTPIYNDKDSYTVTVSSTGEFGTSNSKTFTILVNNIDVAPPITSFVTTWMTTTPSESITIPVDGAPGRYTVDWGDGVTTTTTDTVTGNATHTYATAGTYTVAISGDFTRIYLFDDDTSNAQKLQSVDQWGDIQWSSMSGAFSGASNMVSNAQDVPDLSGVTDMSNMFYLASSDFDSDLSSWNVSNVTDMSNMFYLASSFDSDLSSWNVSNVTDMHSMFFIASSFDSDLSSWNVSNVTDMSNMFYLASSFDSDLSSWNVSNVTDMGNMFYLAASFDSDLSSWNVSNVTDMGNMFDGASSFTSDLSSWNVSNVTDMGNMFDGASSFTSDLSSWNVSNVTDMGNMFDGASSFTSDLSSWNVSNVTDMGNMFDGASSFTSDLSSWNVSNVTDMGNMFDGASSFTSDLSSWNVSNVTDMGNMFDGAPVFSQNLGSWYIVLGDNSIDGGDTSREVASIFAQNTVLNNQSPVYSIHDDDNGDGDSFEIVNNILMLKSTPNYDDKDSYTVTISSTGTFGTSNSKTFTILVNDVGPSQKPFITTWMTTAPNESITIPTGGTLGQYTVDWGDGTEDIVINSRATHTYTVAGTYTVSISGDFTRINLNNGLPNANKLQSVEQWGDIQWSSMKDAFRGASNMVYNAQDAPILSDVTDMSRMFHNTASFNGNLSSWNVSNVENMRLMFKSATSFNGNLSSWNVSNVENMNGMFHSASSFNSDLSSWNVSNVENTNGMFHSASSFDSDLSSWNVSNVTDMNNMFRGASSFNQNLGLWYIVLDDNTIDDGDTSRVVTSISAQNTVLNNQSPVYSIDEDSADGASFEIINSTLMLKSTPSYNDKDSYTVTVLSTGTFGTSNSATFDILVNDIPHAPAPFVTTWKTTTPDESIEIPVGGASGQYTVDWGDGTTTDAVTGDATHIYTDAGTYTVSISGDFKRIYSYSDRSNAKNFNPLNNGATYNGVL